MTVITKFQKLGTAFFFVVIYFVKLASSMEYPRKRCRDTEVSSELPDAKRVRSDLQSLVSSSGEVLRVSNEGKQRALLLHIMKLLFVVKNNHLELSTTFR